MVNPTTILVSDADAPADIIVTSDDEEQLLYAAQLHGTFDVPACDNDGNPIFE